MSSEVKTKNTFDTVKMMRDIRDQIDLELAGKSSEEILAYYAARRKQIAESKKRLK